MSDSTPVAWVKADKTAQAALKQARARTLWQALSDAAAFDPERVALVAADDSGVVQRVTYAQLLTRVRHFSAGLASVGVQRGDRVVLWMTNRLEWVISCFAIARIGASAVPINTFLKPREIHYCIAQSGARHLILLDQFRKLNMPHMLEEICPEFGSATRPGELYSSALPDLRNVILFQRAGQSHPGAFNWSALEAVGQDASSPWVACADAMTQRVSADDMMMVKYTSGSTGFPKGVIWQQGGFVANGILHGQRIGVRREDVYFSMMPLFHAGGSIYGLMSMLPQGGTLVFTEAFSVDLALQLVAQERASIFVSVLGKEVVMKAAELGITFPSVRIGHVHDDESRRILPNATFAFSPYGLTETYGPASLTGPQDPLEKQHSTGGRPLAGNEIRVVDPYTGLDVRPGEIGEAWIRGNIMLGYWNKPEDTAKAIDAEGWLHTEDLVTVDADGYVKYAGRIKLMAKVGGENVSLEEVETVITSHGAILHCAAVSVADARKTEAVRVFAMRRPDASISADQLTTWLSSRVAHFKIPREIVFVNALPRLDNGKLDRLALTQWAAKNVSEWAESCA